MIQRGKSLLELDSKMENIHSTNHNNHQQTVAVVAPTSEEKRRSSLIEHEYIFNTIPKERPLSRPKPAGRRSLEEEGKLPADDGRPTTGKPVNVTQSLLYKEAVYTGAHYLGCPSPQRFPAGQEEICLYTHGIFSESEKETETVLSSVLNEPFPLTIVNCKLKKASDLQGSKTNNGYVDPYCIVTIETEDTLDRGEWESISVQNLFARKKRLQENNLLRPPADVRRDQFYDKVPDHIKTTVQRHKKDPKWDHKFQCLSLLPSVDNLIVEVWDQPVDGKTADIFLGKVSIKISEIPCDGSDRWYYLTGIPHTKQRTPHGRIRLQVWLVHAYRHGMHFTEVADPKVILGHLWDRVLDKEKEKYSDKSQWDGSIPSAATCLLFQYALQNGISEDTHAIIRWNAYAKHDMGVPGLEEVKDVIEKTPVEDNILPPRLSDPQQEIEDNVMTIVKDNVCPVIRNHLKERVESVHEALASYQHCVEILKKYKNTLLLDKILWLVHAALRMCVLEWYQQMHASHVPSHGQVEKGQYVSSVVHVMKEVNALIRLGEVKWSPEFWLTASIEYLPIIYDELQKMVIHDVEAICWLFFQFYQDFQKLRKILMLNEDKDRNLYNSFFDLYKQAQIFVFAQVDIFKGVAAYPFLENYHRWFRPILVLWLGFSLIRGSLMINNTIHIDNNVQDNAHTMTSSSALDTANVFAQLASFWSALQWPDVAEAYVIFNFLMDVMCSYAVLYAELKHSKLDKEGYYDPHGRFTISERLCTALNNIEHVKEQVQLVPKEIDYEHLIDHLEAACGKSPHILNYEHRAQDRLEKTLKIVNGHIEAILVNVGLRIQNEISTYVQKSFTILIDISKERLEDAMEPIIAYLENNIVVLQKALHPQNFHKLLQLLWNLVCIGLHNNSLSVVMSSSEEQMAFFKRIKKVIPYLQKYFEGGDAGLTMAEMQTHDYEDMFDLFNYFTKQTDELISMYYRNRAQYHLNFKGAAKLGTLNVRIGYWDEKLNVNVISASGLTPHDQDMTVLKYFHKMHPTSDSMVELELKPTSQFRDEKKYATQVQWKNLNPVFEENFSWLINEENCKKKSAVVVLTVKDYDLLTKNAFLGEAIIPLHMIPGIAETPELQPMKLTLHEVDKEDHVLLVLNSRKWDTEAKQFSDNQLGKFVEPVVKNT